MAEPNPIETSVVAADHHASGDRPPIFSALNVLGLRNADIGRLFGVSTVSVHEWATGKKPLPVVRSLALIFLAGRLTGLVSAKHPPQTRYARRAQIAREAAAAWTQLARDELDEDVGGVLHAEQIERGYALGQRMLAKLEAQ